MKKQKKDKRRQSTQNLLGIRKITDYCISTDAGDLVFYNTRRRSYSHVGIYLGDNKFIHAPSTGKKVRIDNMDMAYWKSRFNGARRITNPEDRQKIESEKEQILQAFRDDAE